MITSREVLGLPGEHVHVVGSLDTSPGAAARTLFVERAAAVGGGTFAADDSAGRRALPATRGDPARDRTCRGAHAHVESRADRRAPRTPAGLARGQASRRSRSSSDPARHDRMELPPARRRGACAVRPARGLRRLVRPCGGGRCRGRATRSRPAISSKDWCSNRWSSRFLRVQDRVATTCSTRCAPSRSSSCETDPATSTPPAMRMRSTTSTVSPRSRRGATSPATCGPSSSPTSATSWLRRIVRTRESALRQPRSVGRPRRSRSCSRTSECSTKRAGAARRR